MCFYCVLQYNYILVVGNKEMEEGTVNVRTRNNKVHGTQSIPDLISKFRELRDTFHRDEDTVLADLHKTGDE